MQEFSVEMLFVVLGTLQSVILFFVPKFETLEPKQKQIWNVALLAAISLFLVFANCSGFVSLAGVECSASGFTAAFAVFAEAFLSMGIGNATAYVSLSYLAGE